jgi:beta-glucanase (GH16 family)
MYSLTYLKPLSIVLVSSFLTAQNPESRTLTFLDEFNGTELDLTRWSPHHPLKKAGDQTAVEVRGGQLHLDRASSAITTFGTFAQTYGIFEIRCRVTAVPGWRPGFKLLPVPLGPLPEIRVFENASPITFENRWGTEQTQRSYGDSVAGPDLSTEFHTISIDWEPDKIVWFIDGKEKFRSVDGIPHQPMYLLIYLDAVKPDTGGLAGIPAAFDIDSIHVYQRRP